MNTEISIVLFQKLEKLSTEYVSSVKCHLNENTNTPFLKNFTQDYASTSFDRVFSGADKEKLLNQVICQHMYRHGFLEIGEELAKVSIFHLF